VTPRRWLTESLDFARWGEYGLFGVALASLLLIGWAGWRLTRHPDIGASWSPQTGIVDHVNPAGPAAGGLQPGDHILAVDEAANSAEILYFPGKHPGDSVNLLVDRGGERRVVTVTLTRPSWFELATRLDPLLIAFAFWSLGALVLAFTPSQNIGLLFFSFCQAASTALTSGAMAAIGPLWVSQLFGFLLWWLGPLAVHFHIQFPVPEPSRHRWRLAIGLYALALLGSVSELVAVSFDSHSAILALSALRRLWLAINLILVVFLLLRASRRVGSSEERRQIGLVALGGALSLAPLMTLSLLPDALAGQPVLPYEASFLFLSVLPLAYGYAILHHRLLPLDRYVSRTAATALVIALLSGFFLAVNAVLVSLSPALLVYQPATTLIIVLCMTLAFGPIYRYLQAGIQHVLYGGTYDYRSAVQQISHSLSRADSTNLAEALVHGIQTAIQLECACLILQGSQQNPGAVGFACSSCLTQKGWPLQFETSSQICEYFTTRAEPLDAATLRDTLSSDNIRVEEARLLHCQQARLWLPLMAQEHCLGALLVGPKRGGGAFDARDLDILNVVAWQAGIALQNTQLVAELQQRAVESQQLHHAVVRAREEERLRVARELHDQIIQALVGLNYQLSEARYRPDVDGWPTQVQAEVRQIVAKVREICSDLRPPMLDTLGLVAALRDRVRQAGQTGPFRLKLIVEGDQDQEVPDEVSLCLLRALQEALLNVQKHAGATRVTVRLHLSPAEVRLSIEDDGRGFNPPLRLGQLTHSGHFGLVGLNERLNSVGGRLTLTSRPGEGTRLNICVPLLSVQARGAAE
jgi:signal transduction histidine kinase